MLEHEKVQLIKEVEQFVANQAQEIKKSFRIGKSDGMSEILLSLSFNDDGSFTHQVGSVSEGDKVLSIFIRATAGHILTATKFGINLEDFLHDNSPFNYVIPNQPPQR